MKTKTAVLVGIALCTMLLISPALASSTDTLDIYGNANEDDTIDMRDLTYVKLIFFGKKPETELADAKYDGKINPLDFIQIKLIIVGKEKEITIIDSIDRTVTVKKPINRLIALGSYRIEAVKIIGAKDKIVGISNDILKKDYYYPDLLDKPTVGSWGNPDHEAIVSLFPDIVITSANVGRVSELEEKLKPAGITVIGLDFYRDYLLKSEIEKLGYSLDKRNEVREYIDWRESYENPIKDFVEELTEDEKPRVFYEWRGSTGTSVISTFGKGGSGDYSITAAGGRNIAAELKGYSEVDCEWVLSENPDVIIKRVSLKEEWGWHNTEEPKTLISDLIKSRPGWDHITAVKNNRFCVYSREIALGPDSIVGHAHLAKWFHPEWDIDPESIYKEYLEHYIDVEYPEDLIFAYPPLAS